MHRQTATPSSKYAKIDRLDQISLRGKRLKGKGKGALSAKETGGRRAKHPLSLPFQGPATEAIDGSVRLQ